MAGPRRSRRAISSVQIASLRKLLGETPEGYDWIATVPRFGYRSAGAVKPPSSAPLPRGSRSWFFPSQISRAIPGKTISSTASPRA